MKFVQIFDLENYDIPVAEPSEPIPVPDVETGVGFFDRIFAALNSILPWGFLIALWSIWKVLAIILSTLFLIGYIYSHTRASRIAKQQEEMLGEELQRTKTAIQRAENKEWERVMELVDSPNENDWRLAVMEADIMLDDLLRSIGHTQETLGEKLQAVEKSDFNTLDLAWEAHKVRNKIAHEGSNYVLTQREARRVISLFKEVFDEFHYI